MVRGFGGIVPPVNLTLYPGLLFELNGGLKEVFVETELQAVETLDEFKLSFRFVTQMANDLADVGGVLLFYKAVVIFLERPAA